MKDIPLYATLPWDHLDSLVKKDWLIRELKRAMKGRFSPACEKPYKKKSELNRTDLGKPEEDDKLVCYHCGLECDLDAIRKERIDSWMTLEKGIPIQIKEEAQELKGVVDKVTRYRASYCKLGEFRFLSALDLTRSFTRAFSIGKSLSGGISTIVSKSRNSSALSMPTPRAGPNEIIGAG